MQQLLSLFKRVCWLAAWFVIGAHSALAQTTVEPTTVALAGWLDKAGTATAATVQNQATWEPFTGWKGWGYGTEAVWLRVSVPASAHADAAPHILIVRPPYLDRITFFDPAMGTVRHAGDYLLPSEEALGSVLVSFEVPARTETRDVFLKLQTTSTRMVHLTLIPQDEALSLTRSVEWATGAALLLSLVFWVWAVVQWRASRDAVTATFAITQFIVTVWGFGMLGFARVTVGEFFSTGTLSLINSVISALMVACVMWFFSAVLHDYGVRRWMLRALQIGGGLALTTALLHISGSGHLALKLLNTLVPPLLIWTILSLSLAPTSKTKKTPIPKGIMLAYLCFYSFLNAIPTLTHVGLIPESDIMFFGNMSSLVANGLVMLIILNVRQRRFNAQHEATVTQLMLQQEQARLDQQYIDEQRQLMAMLAHEMKTPLANLRIWMEAGARGRPVMERAISDMNRVIERCVHAGQLSDHSLQPRDEWLDASELTQSVLAASRQPSRFKVAIPNDVCAVHTDAQMLSIVLSNLLENAYKYSPPESPITLQLVPHAGKHAEPGWRWTVENAVGSAGFPEAEKVFDKYYRSAAAQRKTGSGLGLFLVKSLLALMRGHVTYTPINEQVRFEVWLPVDGPPNTEAPG
jgi:two-component system, sensor histidine kinase LadS